MIHEKTGRKQKNRIFATNVAKLLLKRKRNKFGFCIFAKKRVFLLFCARFSVSLPLNIQSGYETNNYDYEENIVFIYADGHCCHSQCTASYEC